MPPVEPTLAALSNPLLRYFLATRPAFLSVTLFAALIGIGTAYYDGVPLAMWPAIITVAILTFMGIWNDVLWPLMVIRDERLMTMPLMVTLFAVGGQAEARLGAQLAAATLLALPVIGAYLFLQRHLIESIATSGMKN